MTIQSNLSRLHPSGKFLLLMAMFMVALGAASTLQVLILAYFADMHSMLDIVKLTDYNNPRVIQGMKVAQGVSAVITFIIPALLFAWLSSEKKIGYLKLNKSMDLASAGAAALLVLALMPLVNWCGELNSRLVLPEFLSGVEAWMKNSEENIKVLTESFLKMEGPGDLVVNLLIIAGLAAVGEELLFRGGMQNILKEWSGNRHAAVWIAAIIFSAFHMQFYGFLPRMLLGVVMGYLYIWSGTLWLPILYHFLNNGLAVLFSYLTVRGILPAEAETIGAGESPFYLVMASVLVSTGLLYYIRKGESKE